ncbi:MAG: DUF1961 family protein [Phycisphaeraceae bacterium]
MATCQYLMPASPLAGLEVEGTFESIEMAGRVGLRAASVHSRLGIGAHTVAGKRGALSLWVLPLEDLSPVAPMPHLRELEPDWGCYPLLSDHPQMRDRSQARFHLRYTSDWWRNLTVQFHDKQLIGYNAIIAPDHFRFRRHRWHMIAVTWDKPASQYRLYVNGVLVAAENPFLAMPAETAGQTIYAGNPAFALSGLSFYDRPLGAEPVAALYAAERTADDADLVAQLRHQHTGKGLPHFDWSPDGAWQRQLERTFTQPGDLEGFWIQGQEDSASITPEGLLVDTAPGDSQRHGLRHNKVEMYLWSERVFEGEVALEVDFKLLKPNGLALVMVHAAGMQREDFMADYPRRSDGSMKMVCWENVRNYHWEFYRETDNTRADLATHLLVKNPWMMGLAYQAQPQRLVQDVWHTLRLVQEGGRLRGAIDGMQVFDVRDRADINTGPIYDFGRIALRCKFKTKMLYRNLRVWTRRLPYRRSPIT